MIRVKRTTSIRMLVLALYALASLGMGLAHKPVQSSSTPDLALYALPDGSLPVLCLTSDGEGGGHAYSRCQACLLTSAPGLLPSMQLATWLHNIGTDDRLRISSQAPRTHGVGIASLGARGPPRA